SRAGTEDRSNDADATFPPSESPSRIARMLSSGRLSVYAAPAGYVLGVRTLSSLTSPLPPPCNAPCRKSEEHHIWGVINRAGTGCSGLVVPGCSSGPIPSSLLGLAAGHLWGGGPARPGPP